MNDGCNNLKGEPKITREKLAVKERQVKKLSKEVTDLKIEIEGHQSALVKNKRI